MAAPCRDDVHRLRIMNRPSSFPAIAALNTARAKTTCQAGTIAWEELLRTGTGTDAGALWQ
jgi:hypothetical protein